MQESRIFREVFWKQQDNSKKMPLFRMFWEKICQRNILKQKQKNMKIIVHRLQNGNLASIYTGCKYSC